MRMVRRRKVKMKIKKKEKVKTKMSLSREPRPETKRQRESKSRWTMSATTQKEDMKIGLQELSMLTNENTRGMEG